MEHQTLSRRRHSRELKAQVLEECSQPGASVAAIALAHGLNANLVHKWRRHAKRVDLLDTPGSGQFIALPIAPEAPDAVPVRGADIRIELQRGVTTVNVIWPVSAAGDCAQWMRELLR